MSELTTMTDTQLSEPLIPPRDSRLAVWYLGQRYGGFVDDNHVRLWAASAGIAYDDLKLEYLEETPNA